MSLGRRRRGVVILGVMVIVVIAVLGATTLIHRTGSELAAAQAVLRRTRARAGAWSGVQGVMAELAGQRDAMLAGGVPSVTAEWYLGEETGARTRIRIIPIGDGPPEGLLESEAGKLDLNTASAEMLALLPGVGEALGAAIAAGRAQGRFASIDDLLRIPGVTRMLLDGEPLGSEEVRGGAGTPALRSLVTPGSFDPSVQCGLGERGRDHAGLRRINLNLSWSDSLERAIDDRFGAGAGAGVKNIINEGNKFGTRRDIASFMRRMNLPPETFGVILDAFTARPELFTPGLIDLNLAPVEVLACIPGIDAPAAAEIVSRRDALDEMQRQSVAWPLVLGILSPEAFEEAVDHLTTRTLQWRVRVESGIVEREEEGASASWGEALVRDVVTFEAVIDLGSTRPRIAYLRDVTMLGPAERLRASREPAPPEAELSPEGGSAGIPSEGSSERGEDPSALPPWSDEPPEVDTDPVEEPPSGDPDPEGAQTPMEEAEPDPPAEAGDNRSGRWTTGGPS